MADPILMYLPGFAFLFLVNAAIATLIALILRDRSRAIPLSVLLSATILKAIAVIQIGYFDLSFLVVLFSVGLVTAVLVHEVVDKHSPRRRVPS